MKWEYNEKGNYWCSSRPMDDEVCIFFYTIYPTQNGGYIAEANNNAYGACRVAVKDEYCEEQSVFNDLNDLMIRIENRDVYWLYVSHCNCIGEITKEEY